MTTFMAFCLALVLWSMQSQISELKEKAKKDKEEEDKRMGRWP